MQHSFVFPMPMQLSPLPSQKHPVDMNDSADEVDTPLALLEAWLAVLVRRSR